MSADVHKKVITNALAFISGFSVIFIIAGLFAATIGPYMLLLGDPLMRIIGVVVIILGMNMSGFWKPRLLNQEARFHVQKGRLGLISSFLIGAAFAFGWTPCVGPILAPILIMAGGTGNKLKGGLMLATYSLGLGVPFFLSALSVNGLLAFSSRMKKHFGVMELIVGSLLIFVGIYLLIGGSHGMAVIRGALNWDIKEQGDAVTYPTAFIGGLVSFITPCVLPLVPVYLSILSGTSFGQLTGKDK